MYFHVTAIRPFLFSWRSETKAKTRTRKNVQGYNQCNKNWIFFLSLTDNLTVNRTYCVSVVNTSLLPPHTQACLCSLEWQSLLSASLVGMGARTKKTAAQRLLAGDAMLFLFVYFSWGYSSGFLFPCLEPYKHCCLPCMPAYLLLLWFLTAKSVCEKFSGWANNDKIQSRPRITQRNSVWAKTFFVFFFSKTCETTIRTSSGDRSSVVVWCVKWEPLLDRKGSQEIRSKWNDSCFLFLFCFFFKENSYLNRILKMLFLTSGVKCIYVLSNWRQLPPSTMKSTSPAEQM